MLFALCATLLPLATASSIRAEHKKPNFLFILADDQSPETLSAYGNKVCETPHLDRLAAEGMVFDDAHHMGSWSGAVCRPSRTMIMTGRTVWRIPGFKDKRVRRKDRKKPNAAHAAAAKESLPAVFRRAGYDTMRTCKRGNSFNAANDLFETSRIATKRSGTEPGGSEWHGDQVVEFLESRKAKGEKRPFLIYFGFSHPHDPRHATEELAKKYGANNRGNLDVANPKAPPLPINYLPAHPFHHGHPGLRDEEKVQGVGKRRDPPTVRNELGREYACIENIDRQVGRVVEMLRKSGELENTYVVYTADHGIAVGRHGLLGKQNLYEHTWRVPFIVRGPRIRSGSRASGYIYLLDVLPTFCDLASIEIPSTVEGKSFRSVLEGEKPRIRDILYGTYSGGTKPGMRAVKTDGWKLIRYDVLDGKVRETQLFDLRKNPHELLAEHRTDALTKLLGITPTAEQIDLAESPKHATKRDELERLLEAEMKRLGDPYELKP